MSNNRVCCLYRVSTLKQVDPKEDIPMQKKECREFAKRNGWNIVKEYAEKGVSGCKVSADKRDVLLEVKRDAANKEFDILLVFMFDRLGRIESETPFVVEWFAKDAGVQVWSVIEGQQKFEDHTDNLINYLRFWQASGESKKTSMRVSTRLGQLVTEGNFRGGIAPYGYKLVKGKRYNHKKEKYLNDIVVEPFEATIVREIFYIYVYKGYGINKIINYLDEKGVVNHNGNSFSFSSIRHMLKNKLYLGIMKSGDTFSKPFEHLKILDEEIFNKAQEILRQRSRHYEGIRTIPNSTKSASLLSGNIFCGHCGSRLSVTTGGNTYQRQDGTIYNNKKYKYYCYNRRSKKRDCTGQTTYSMKVIDKTIQDIVLMMFEKLEMIPKSEIISSCFQEEKEQNETKMEAVKTELQKEQNNLKTLQNEVLNVLNGTSKFTSDVLNDLMEQTKEKINDLTATVNNLQYEHANLNVKYKNLQEEYKELLSYSEIFKTADLATKKMIVSYLISEVHVFSASDLKINFNITYEQFLKPCVS